jgi:serine-type D-Ala-D-Ala carboxypeptidase/endopeptidase (penicillin-binding protein 4)
LAKAQVPADAMVACVQTIGSTTPRLAHQRDRLVNPASLEKLFTTQAALDLLGPAWRWQTPVWLDGTLNGDTLNGRLVIKGVGDPKLVVERLWLLLQRVRSLGVVHIRGDIVLDQSAFTIAEEPAERFDNEPLRPYNVHPQPLLLNQKSVLYTFTPQPARGVASVSALPALEAGPITVPLSSEPCSDWRLKLKARWMASGPTAPGSPGGATGPTVSASGALFAGSYPQACGERLWPAADASPDRYHERILVAFWRNLGGSLQGRVVESREPVRLQGPDTPPAFLFDSPPLAEVVRDINKYSNNTMAKQLFLTLALQRQGAGTATWAQAREVLQAWMAPWLRQAPAGVFVDNGSGLSRDARVSAGVLTQLLHHAWRAPSMPDFMASLPASGLDGTLLRSKLGAGRAHLKTGSLRDVAGVAGYVLGASGQRHAVVAVINHDNANAARAALDAVVAWAADDAPGRARP